MRARTRWVGILLLGSACLLPWLVSDYRLFQFTMVLVYAIALFGLNLLVGYCGQISLGHGAFYALGAYCAALLMTHVGIPYWATLPACAAVSLLAGYLFGLPAARLQGLYLALATFSLALALPQLLKHKWLAAWTGGVQGLVLDKPEPPDWLPLSADQWLYCFSLAVALMMGAIGLAFTRGRIGRALRAVRDQPVAATAMGIDTRAVKAKVFGVSAMYAGVAGGLSALVVQFVGPDSFDMFLSISFLVGIVIGGLASVSGALLGALFIQFVPPLAANLSVEAAWAIYGVLLLICVGLLPSGLASVLRRGLSCRETDRSTG